MTRLVAAVIDGTVVGAVLVVGYFGLAFVLYLVNPRSFALPRLGLFFSLTSAFVAAFGYLTIAWAFGGRSYGDLVMGLRTLGRGRRPMRVPLAAARAFLVVVVPIGILWVPVNRSNRSLHDVLLGTEVVYDWQPRGVHTPPPG